MSLSAQIAVIAGISLVVAGAAYLMIVRGPSLLLDLSASLTQLLCV